MDKTLLRVTTYVGALASALIILLSTYRYGSPFTPAVYIENRFQAAAIFLVQSITVEKLRSDYLTGTTANTPPFSHESAQANAEKSDQKVRVLIVPGHEPDFGGTAFGNSYERTIVLDIANDLAKLLSANPHYTVMISRTKTAWNPILQSYFDAYATEIETFRKSQATQMANHLATGDILPQADQIYHNTTPSLGVLHLYGINKWTSENGYNLTIHIHVNDYAGRRSGVAGKYAGFSIYAPNHQYSNGIASIAIGNAIAARLNKYHATSTFPGEAGGVIEDQQLIAIGSNNSINGAALLIEYGYIYEPQFTNSSILSIAEEDYAYETYLGLQDFFNDTAYSTGSGALPYDWNAVNGTLGEMRSGVYALQSALRSLGFYPPIGKNFNDCPISGKVWTCTRMAIMAYQNARGLKESGTLDPDTRSALFVDFPLSEPPLSQNATQSL